MFNRLASQFRQRGVTDELLELYKLHRKASPNAPELLEVEVESAWDLANYEQVVQLLTPWPKEQRPSSYTATSMRVQLVRSLLRLNRPDEAMASARDAATKANDRFPLLLTMVDQRNVEEVRKLLEDENLTRRGLPGAVLQSDPELAPLVTFSEFAELRRTHPFGLPHEMKYGFYVLLLKEPRVPDVAELHRRLGRADAASGNLKLEPSSRSGEVWTIVEDRGFTLLIAFGGGPFVSAKEIDRLELRRPDLQRVLAEHHGWISVATISRPRDASSTDESPARELAARLCDASVVGFYYSQPQTYLSYLAAANEDAGQQLMAKHKVDDPLTNSITVWLTRNGDESEYSNRQTWNKKRQSLKVLAGLLAEQSRDRPAARVLLQRGHAEEELWLNLISAKHTRYGNYEFVAEFQIASKLWPHLTPGERCVITNYEIQEWREQSLCSQ